jgi:hypothetical protein
MKPHFRYLNHTSAVVTFIDELRTFEFLLVFFVSQARISLLGEVNHISDTVDNQGSQVLKLQGSDLLI